MVEVFGLGAETPPGPFVWVVAADAEDPYRIAGQILAVPDADGGRIGGGGEPGPFVRVVAAGAEDPYRERCVPAVG
ncbi:hypothetical protein [Streptomyces hygroscopicus]|uniref:hypothetical protein n=1 Tax=Streptomyces hygroscopicus TaxID=1912 RepID=UPI0033E5FDDA